MSEKLLVCALDLETSGLDEQKDQVLEVGAIFGEIYEGEFNEWHAIQAVLRLDSDVRAWEPSVVAMHVANGLLPLTTSPEARSPELVDSMLSAYAAYEPNSKWVLMGQSVHFDLRFVRRIFPQFASHLSHRVLDVSSILMMCRSMGMPDLPTMNAHRAMNDVRESLRTYALCVDFLQRGVEK